MFFIPSDFDIRSGYFVRESNLHGKLHTYRVMCHVLVLGKKMDMPHYTKLAFCAAFVHDMARRHDGFSLMHGPRAARKKVPEFIPLFKKYGINDEDISAIKSAVSNHSKYVDLKKDHPHYLVAALLKDADALDRVRIGHKNLNVRFLRLSATPDLIVFSQQLFDQTCHKKELTMSGMLDLAGKLLGEDLYI